MRHSSRFARPARVASLALAVGTLLSIGSALAGETLYGGGATLPAQAYVGNGYNLSFPASRLSTNAGNNAGVTFQTAGITPGSIFAEYTTLDGNKISYCQTGGWEAKYALNGEFQTASGDCADFSLRSSQGFSAAGSSPDFAGTGAPYSTTDYNSFLTGRELATHQGIVQIPTLAGAIALSFNGYSVGNVKLTSAQVCRIYSGLIKTWTPIQGVTGTGRQADMKIVYRTDGDGTSFYLTQYLANTCNGTTNVPVGFTFYPNAIFNDALPGGVAAVYGSRAIQASGNTDVVMKTQDQQNIGALGYADIAEVVAQSAPYALVNALDPAKFGLNSAGVQTPLTFTSTDLMMGKVLDGPVVNAAPGNGSATIKDCLKMINPTAKVGTTYPYPIVAYTYLSGYYQGNGTAAHVTAIKNLFDLFYDRTNRPALPTGYAYLDGAPVFGALLKGAVNTCVNP